MSQDVNISGIEWNDGFLPKWATEKTLEKVVNILQEKYGLSNKQARDLRSGFNQMHRSDRESREQSKSLIGGLKDTIKKSDKERKRDTGLRGALGDDASQEKRRMKDAADESATSLNAFAESSNAFISEIDFLDNAFHKISRGPLRHFKTNLDKSSAKLAIMAGTAGLVGNLLGRGIALYRENVNVLRSLNEVGLRLSGTHVEVAQNLAEMGMSGQQFEKIMTNYSTAMGTFGTRALVNVTKSAENAEFRFTQFGLTMAEGAEYTAEMLQQQRLAGIFRARDEQRQAEVLRENIRDMTAYSRILNVSREQLMKSNTEMLSRDDVQRRFFGMEKEERERAQKSMRQVNTMFAALGPVGAEFGKMFTDMNSNVVPEASESFRRLARVSPALAAEMADLSRQVMSGTEVTREEAMARMRSIHQQVAGQRELLQMLAHGGGEAAEMANRLGAFGMSLEEAEVRIQEMEEAAAAQNMSLEEYARQRMEAEDPNVQAATAVTQSLNKLDESINLVTVQGFDKLFQALGGPDGLEQVASGIERLSGFLRDFANNMDNPEWWRETFGDVGRMIVDALREPLSDMTVAITAAVIGVLGAGALLGGFPGAGRGRGRGVGGIGGAARLGGRLLAGAGIVAGGGLAVGEHMYQAVRTGDFRTDESILGMAGNRLGEWFGRMIHGEIPEFDLNEPVRARQVSELPEKMSEAAASTEEMTDSVEGLINSLEDGELKEALTNMVNQQIITNNLMRELNRSFKAIPGLM